MDGPAIDELIFLSDEKFDFDVSLSPGSSLGDGDGDDVFTGSVGQKEKCVSANRESCQKDSVGGGPDSLSPLTGDQLDAVFQEAHKLADRLQSCEANMVHVEEQEKPSQMSNTTNEGEEFVQDVENKLSMLSQPASVFSPLKRQTFIVQDSPMKELPPIFQQRLLRGSSSTATPSSRLSKAPRLSASIGSTSSTRPAPSTRVSTRLSTSTALASSTRPAPSTRLSTRLSTSSRLSTASRLSTSSPTSTAKSNPVQALRGKAMSSVGVVLPNKPAAVSGKKVERAKLQPASKVAPGWNKSPSSRSSSRAPSSEDLLSDSMSVASDMSDSSLNSSQPGKHSLAPPTKRALNKRSAVKAPPPQTRQMTDRRKTSSSSSSVSSFNSSLSLSPAPGKVTTSANRRLSSAAGPTPNSINKPAIQNRSRRSVISAVSETSAAACRPSGILRKTSESEQGKAGRSTPLKRAEGTSLQPPSAKRVLEASVPATRLVKSKPQALVPPTVTGIRRGVNNGEGSSPDSSRLVKPKQPVSVSNKQVLPQMSMSTPVAGGCRSVQVKTRRPSALPTPVRRGMSAIPLATPTNLTGVKRPLADSDPSPARKTSNCSATPADTQDEESVDVPLIKPFCLEDDGPVSPPSIREPEQPESTDTEMPGDCTLEPGRRLEQETQEEGPSKQQEILLLDLPAPTPQPLEKLLIDLTNTPDLMRTNVKSGTTSQLIDLSSPLIKWSPEDKRENNALLINLSF